MKKALSLLLLIALIMVPILSACNSNKDTASDDKGKTGDNGTKKHKIGILAPAVTHGWVAAVAYNAEIRAKELSSDIEYKIQTSNNAEEMTSQLDDLKTWGAEAIVAFPQWEGMEVPI